MSISSKIALAMSADGASFEEVHDNLVKIAEDFAIGFAEWTFINFPNQYKVHQYKEKDGFYTTKKLLEIYKKEII